MILNVLLIAFLLLMIAWWANQGLFSGLLHVLLTIFAAMVALALWEPLVYGWLLGRMPEYAWGVGLLVPFALALFVLRTIFDRMIPGNTQFHHLIDRIGGGLAGLASGVLTAGMLLTGLNMAGLPDVLGYHGWKLGDDGAPQRTASLWINADTITAGLLERIANGALVPIAGGRALDRVHPHLDVGAAMYNRPPFEATRRAIRPGNAALLEGGVIRAASPPDKVAKPLTDAGAAPAGDAHLLAVGAEVTLQPNGAADTDGVFRISPAQIALLSRRNHRTETHHPVGYIQNGQLQPFGPGASFAYSPPGSVQSVRYHWLFHIPADAEPEHLRLKHLRLPIDGEPRNDSEALASLVTYDAEAQQKAEADEAQSTAAKDGAASDGEQQPVAEVSAFLPFTINKNELGVQNVEIVKGAVRSGNATVQPPDNPPGTNLAINQIYHNPKSEIIQVNLGSPRDNQSILGQAVQFARRATQPPLLVDADGQKYFAMGYGIRSGGRFTFSLDPNRTIQSLKEVEIGRVSEGDELTLYFQVPEGVTITAFQVGQDKMKELNLKAE